jgi:hypothetical protein
MSYQRLSPPPCSHRLYPQIDLISVKSFAVRVVSLAEYRQQLHEYLRTKMGACAPNLASLVGEQVGARLISHAGTLALDAMGTGVGVAATVCLALPVALLQPCPFFIPLLPIL